MCIKLVLLIQSAPAPNWSTQRNKENPGQVMYIRLRASLRKLEVVVILIIKSPSPSALVVIAAIILQYYTLTALERALRRTRKTAMGNIAK